MKIRYTGKSDALKHYPQLFCMTRDIHDAKILRMLALDDLSGCKADVRRLSRKPVSFDSAIACDHFKIILILPIGIETFYS
ncbi:MAG: hypothetical protein E7F52_22770, partial [Klebsiella pneumoniae]|nr:hypothetical protein [Klebsiella pneumoniae]